MHEKKDSIVTNIAINSLVELSVSLAMVGLSIPFVATGAACLTLLATAGATYGVNTLSRCIQGYSVYSRLEEATHRSTWYQKQELLRLEQEAKLDEPLLHFLRGMNFSFLDTTTRDVLVHEMGHALTARAVYKTRPTIAIFPLKGGETRFSPYRLTGLGEYFGAQKSMLIVSAAGAGAALIFALFNLSAAHALNKEHPEASTYLRAIAMMSILNHTIYALSALFPSNFSGHDFIMLANSGIHPLFAAGFIVLVPALLELGFFLAR